MDSTSACPAAMVPGSDGCGVTRKNRETRGEQDSVAAVNTWLAAQESDAMVKGWRQHKDLQIKNVAMKSKLADAEKELKAARAKQASFSAILDRETLRLNARINDLTKELEQRNRQPPPLDQWAPIDSVRALQKRVFELEAEVQRLQRVIQVRAYVRP
jgi:hypothetical protein